MIDQSVPGVAAVVEDIAVGSEDAVGEPVVARWAMIPLTRAMDTPVINISDKPGPVREALEALREKRADFLEWVKL